MKYKVIWHPDSREEVANVVLTVKNTFGPITAKRVIAKFHEMESLLSSNPYLGTEDKDNPPCRVFHSWHNRIYYVFDNETINILAVWDNRQDYARIPDMLGRRNKR